jgi:putative ABC transport system ATP-binding protein
MADAAITVERSRVSTAGRLAARDVRHAYADGAPLVVDVDRLEVAAGESVALTGASGSGKTTLAYLLTGIEALQAGSVRWGEVELAGMGERQRDAWRRRQVGFVFQDFHLVPGLSILANVLVSAWFERLRPDAATVTQAQALLESFKVPTAGRKVTDLSRGEQQRVAIARALLWRPQVLIADEPTASLDAAAGASVIRLLLDATRESGATFLAVTHDQALIEAVGSVYALDRGRLSRLR